MQPLTINYAAFTGYLPPEAQPRDRQVLVQVFVDPDNSTPILVTLSTRRGPHETWSQPVDLVRAQ
jgi:hypothetical protein